MGVLGGEFKIQAMYVEALSEGSRTRVRFPPPPPDFAPNMERGEVCRAEALSEGGLIKHLEATARQASLPLSLWENQACRAGAT